MKQPPPLLTAYEVMSWLRISRATFHRLIHKGIICGFQIGRCWRVSLDELQAIANRRTVYVPRRKAT